MYSRYPPGDVGARGICLKRKRDPLGLGSVTPPEGPNTILAFARTNKTDRPTLLNIITYHKATNLCCRRSTAKEKALWRWLTREDQSNLIHLIDRGTPKYYRWRHAADSLGSLLRYLADLVQRGRCNGGHMAGLPMPTWV